MLNRFGESYRDYLTRTGMLLPRALERSLGRRERPQLPLTFGRAFAILLVLLGVCVGSGFLLRAYTVRHLPLAPIAAVDTIAVTADDLAVAKELLASVLEDANVAPRLLAVRNRTGHHLLAYFIPNDYVMQE